MKRATTPCLVAGAIALGIAGLATAATVASAAESSGIAENIDSTFAVHVGEGIGLDPNNKGLADSGISQVSLELKPAQSRETTAGAMVVNNSGKPSVITVKDKDDDTNLVGDNNEIIPARDGQPLTTESSWALKFSDKDDYKAVLPSSSAGANVLTNQQITDNHFYVTYAASASPTQKKGTYTDIIEYSLSTQQ